MPYATVSDVAIDCPGLDTQDPASVERALTLLDRAEALIRREVDDLDGGVADGRVSLVLLKQVESEMVASVLDAPPAGGLSSSTETTTEGPFSRSSSRTYATGSKSGMAMSDDQRKLLGVPLLNRGLYTMDLGGAR